MIQRLQSIFLLLASGAFFLQFVFPLASTEKPAPSMFKDMIYNIHDHMGLMGIAVAGGVLAFANIFLFKNRPLQMRLGYVLIVLAILLVALAAIFMVNAGIEFTSKLQINDEIGLYLPAVVIACVIFANRYIKKDEDTVRSMDRLR